MSGVGHEGSPLWNRAKMRRRKFVEELPAEIDSEQEEAIEAATDDEHDGVLNVMA